MESFKGLAIEGSSVIKYIYIYIYITKFIIFDNNIQNLKMHLMLNDDLSSLDIFKDIKEMLFFYK